MPRLHPLLSIPALALALLLPGTGCKDAEHADGATAGTKVEPGRASPPPVEPKGETGAPTAEGAGAEAAGGGEETDTGEAVEPPPPLPEEFDEVGVAACDEYVVAYLACIEKAPEAEREAARRKVFDNITSWTQTKAGGPAAEKGLMTACKIATEQAKRATQPWGCDW